MTCSKMLKKHEAQFSLATYCYCPLPVFPRNMSAFTSEVVNACRSLFVPWDNLIKCRKLMWSGVILDYEHKGSHGCALLHSPSQ